jgi:RNA-directed DNA polymerase
MDTLRQLRYRRQRLLKLQNMQELALLVGQPEHKLQLLAAVPPYNEFTVKKRDGSPRFIEDPQPKLKQVLRTLNAFLQGVYYFEKPDASYGFIPVPKDDPAPPRHIVTHAERHLGCKWLMNIDLEDFFHQVSTEEVAKRLGEPPFQFDNDVAELLARLATYKGRLPQGSPTSPVLSNLVFMREDLALETWSRSNGWLYTRYADDLTFSSEKEITPALFQQTINLLENHGYRVHPRKRRLCGPGDEKSVTRLVLGEEAVQLPADFWDELTDLIEDLRRTTRVQHRMGEEEPPWLVNYRQRVQGMVGFAEHVLGDHHEDFHKIRRAFNSAMEPPAEDFGSYSWLDFPYF